MSASERCWRSKSVAETEQIGAALGRGLRSGDLVALDGELGAGKTALVRGLALGLGLDAAEVRSPTYVLHHVHRGALMTLHHIDCYRLGDGADLDVLEIEGLLEEGVVVIEWGAFADLSEYSPIRGRLEVVSATERRLVLDGNVPSRVDDAMSSLHAHRGAPT